MGYQALEFMGRVKDSKEHFLQQIRECLSQEYSKREIEELGKDFERYYESEVAPIMEEVAKLEIFFPSTLDSLKKKVTALYNRAFDKLKTKNRIHACCGLLISVLVVLGGVALTIFTAGAGAYLGRALIQTGISGIAFCIQGAIAGKFSWGDFAIEAGASLITALFMPMLQKQPFKYKLLFTAGLEYAKELVYCLKDGRSYDFAKATRSAAISCICMGIAEKSGLNNALYGDQTEKTVL